MTHFLFAFFITLLFWNATLKGSAQDSQSNNDGSGNAIFDYFEVKEVDQVEMEEEEISPGWLNSMSDQFYNSFQSENFISEEKLAYLLEGMLHYVINGISYSPEAVVPEFFAGVLPPFEVPSTLSRRNRYLREFNGHQETATEAAIARNHNYLRRIKIGALNIVPFLGMPSSYSLTLWYQLREIAFIAAIHGHDLENPQVKTKILSALLGGNFLKIPATSVDLIARLIVKKIILQAGIKAITASAIPAHLIFNYFTENSARVSTHAKTLFAGENSLPIPEEEYNKN
jgi:hypothetical protein